MILGIIPSHLVTIVVGIYPFWPLIQALLVFGIVSAVIVGEKTLKIKEKASAINLHVSESR